MVYNEGDKDACYYHSMTFSWTEQMYTEPELCLHYRFYPQLINHGKPSSVTFVTSHPHINQATKDTTTRAKVQLNRYGRC